jgi:hypothetical protein
MRFAPGLLHSRTQEVIDDAACLARGAVRGRDAAGGTQHGLALVSASKATDPELLATLQNGELAFVSVAEFARILRVSVMLVYRQIEVGALEVNQWATPAPNPRRGRAALHQGEQARRVRPGCLGRDGGWRAAHARVRVIVP